MGAYTYTTEEIWVQNGEHRIYGIAYVPKTDGRVPLVIFSHELGNDHTSGVRYAERLPENGYAPMSLTSAAARWAATAATAAIPNFPFLPRLPILKQC